MHGALLAATVGCGVTLIALATPARTQPPAVTVARCTAPGTHPGLVLHVIGLRSTKGKLRVQIHGSQAETWLKRGMYLKREVIPVDATTMDVCVSGLTAGSYGVALLHDENGDGHTSSGDGGGFSQNPSFSVFSKPRYAAARFAVADKQIRLCVVMKYGMSLQPVLKDWQRHC